MPRPSKKKAHTTDNISYYSHEILMNAPIGIFTSSPEGRFISVNPAMVDMYGYGSAQEMIESVTDVTSQIYADPVDRHRLFKFFDGVESVKDFEALHRRRDGSKFWTSESIHMVRDYKGNITCLHGFIRDITERKNAEQAEKESEERFRQMFTNAPMPYQSLDEQGNFLDVNQTFLDVLGYSREELIGKSFGDIVHPDWRNHFRENFPKFKAVGEIMGVEFEMIKKDGATIIVYFNGKIQRDNQGRFLRTHCIFQDVTDIKKKEEALHESEARFRNLFEHVSTVAVQGYRLDGTTIFWNKASEKFYGFSSDEAIGKNLLDLIIPDEMRQDVLQEIKIMRESGSPISAAELQLKRKDGSRIQVFSSHSLIQRHGHEPVLFCIDIDLTERKRAEEALEKRLVALTQPLDSSEGFGFEEMFNIDDLQRLQDEFAQATNVAAIITHPDGTPITAPSNFCHLCNIIRSTEIGLANCIQSDSVLGRMNHNGPVVQPCLSGGLWDAGAAIYVGDRHIANWLIGQVRDEEQNEETIRAYARAIGADEDAAAQAFQEVPAMSRQQFKQVADALFTLATQLSNTAYQNVQQARFITDRRKAEEEKEKLQSQLLQAQKMESIGILAGGVAHDFNNLLQVIRGNMELLEQNNASETQFQSRTNTISKSLDRAAQLVQQLLLFSRNAESQKSHVDLNNEINSVVLILERTIPKMISLKLHKDHDLWPVSGDPVQIEQVLLNLANNAVDAMPDGGSLTIETRNIELDEQFVRVYPGLTPGRHILLTVSDTGCGMDKEVLEHIFDPFFTTKEVGKGTGLGLASAYGIVKAHGGQIQCYSEPGSGTTFKIYLPAVENVEQEGVNAVQEEPLQGGHETILVVDDEPDIRELAMEGMEMLGYSVKTAGSGEEALKAYQDHGDSIDLILLDLNMPGMGGYKCLQELLQIDPSAKVVIASGYTANGHGKDMLSSGARAFIGKPYQLKELAAIIRETLDTD